MMRLLIVSVLCVVTSSVAGSENLQRVQGASPESIESGEALIDKFSYYDDGKVMSCSKLTPEGRLVNRLYYYHDGKVEKIERFDRYGEKIEESNYDDAGNLEENIDGWAAKRWVYKDGNLRVESVYGADGRLKERYLYNEAGDLVDRQYAGDGNIDPDEEFNRGVVVTHETDRFYDRYGRETGSITTDVDDPNNMFLD